MLYILRIPEYFECLAKMHLPSVIVFVCEELLLSASVRTLLSCP